MDPQTMSLVMMVGVFVLMYVIMILPQKKKEKKKREMINAAVQGDKITTIGGLTGTIVSVKDDTIVFETGSDRTKITIYKWAVNEIVPKVTEEN